MTTNLTYNGQGFKIGNEATGATISFVEKNGKKIFWVSVYNDGYVYSALGCTDIKQAIDSCIQDYNDMIEFIKEQ